MLKKVFVVITVVLSLIFSGLVSYGLENDELSAVSAVLYYPEYGTVLFEKNSEKRLSMASTTKIMTSLLALEANTPFLEVEITEEMVNVEGTSSGLKAGDKICLKDLVYCMLLESGNDAANSVALALGSDFEGFARMMNERAEKIGMKSTSFVTPSGLDDENHYTTAYDMALLASEAVENEEFVSICSASSEKISFIGSDKSVTLYNHNRLLDEYEGCIGIKTGFTKKSGRCLVSAANRRGIELVAVTLNAGDDWNDHKKLLDYGFSLIESIKADGDFSSYSVSVIGGGETEVFVKNEEVYINTLNYDETDITRKIHLEKFLYAPVEEGETIGFAEYYNGDTLVKTVPLTAKNAVAVENTENNESWINRLFSLFDSWWKNG